jgi:hypothetical protein
MHNTDNGELKIKGSVIKDPRDWTRTAYGPDAYQAALSTLTESERAMVDGTLLPSSWYPIGTWDKFLAAMRVEAQARGDSTAEFNKRNMREAGSVIVRTVYKFMLGLMNARTVIDKALVVFSRAYNQGRFEPLENLPGRAVIRVTDVSRGFRENFTHMLPTAMVFVLELNGAKNVQAEISRDEVVDDKLTFEVSIRYDA